MYCSKKVDAIIQDDWQLKCVCYWRGDCMNPVVQVEATAHAGWKWSQESLLDCIGTMGGNSYTSSIFVTITLTTVFHLYGYSSVYFCVFSYKCWGLTLVVVARWMSNKARVIRFVESNPKSVQCHQGVAPLLDRHGNWCRTHDLIWRLCSDFRIKTSEN